MESTNELLTYGPLPLGQQPPRLERGADSSHRIENLDGFGARLGPILAEVRMNPGEPEVLGHTTSWVSRRTYVVYHTPSGIDCR